MIDEGDIPSVQSTSKMSLNRSNCERIDGLSFNVLDFYVPLLTPHLSCTETSLQLSENISFFASCRIYTGVNHKETYIIQQVFGRYHLHILCTVWGTRRNLVTLRLYFFWRTYFTYDRHPDYFLG
jgi:hypothetical protein